MSKHLNPVLNEKMTEISADGLSYRELNAKLREAVAQGTEKIKLTNVCGQRYLGTDLNKPVEIEIYGTPGNDLGSFMEGPRITVYGNAQDCCGNTMNDGEIVVHGNAGDVVGLSARGGKIFIRDSVGYRAGIHMKEYQEKKPIIVIGGSAQDFCGEYMAGGILVLLGINSHDDNYKANFIGTGMHGGVMYLGNQVEAYQLGKEVGIAELNENDNCVLRQYVTEFASHFNYNVEEILNRKFIKLFPRWLRPYGQLYVY